MVAQMTIDGKVYTSHFFGSAHASTATIGADAGSGPVDEDGDGMYDWLVAKIGIAGADASKAYRVLAELVDADGAHIEWATGTAEAGETFAELYFNGAVVFEHGKTAKYVITDVRLFETGDDWEVQTDARSNWLQLDGSTWATFNHELVSVAGTGSDSIVWPTGSQTGNLSVGLDVNFDVAITGAYNYSASLRASDGALISSAYGTTRLSSSVSEGIGTQRVSMTFSGADIIAAGKAGPWVVTDVLLWNSSNELSAEGEYETRAWSVGDFKTTTLSKLAISGPASVASGNSATYTCNASYSDGTSKRVSPTWTLYSGGSYGNITSGGVFTACETTVERTVTIQATFGGKTAKKTVTVAPKEVQTVSFDRGDGTAAAASRTYTVAEQYGSFPMATLAGQAFVGWFTHRVGGTQVLETDVVPPSWPSRTLFAHWTTEQRLGFNANGGTCSNILIFTTIGGSYPALPTASRPGYAFTGWYTTASGGSLVQAGDAVTATAERTLYAHWTRKQVLYFNGVDGEPAVACRTNTIGAAYGKLPTATLAGQAFVGWFTHRVGGTQVLATDIVPEWTPRTLFAHWTNVQTVVFDANGGSTPESQRARTIGASYGTLPAATRSGHALLGWYTKASGGTAVSAGDTVTAVATRTLYAHWTDKQVATFKGNGGTPSTQKTTNTIYATYGAMPTAKQSGHVFLGWFNAAVGGKQVYTNSTVTLAAARTLYAHWTDQQVVTFRGNGGTPSTQKTTNTIYAKYGTFPSVTWANHVFLGWYTEASEADGKRVYTNSTVTLADTRTLWAQWTDKQVVTFRGNGGSPDVQRLTNTMGKAYGTLPEPKRSGQVFQGWFTAEEGGTQVKGTDKATAATARTLWAHWTDRQVTVFKGNGGTPKTQRMTNTIYAAYGELPTATLSEHVLTGWYTAADGGKRVYTNSTVTLAAERTLYAHWSDRQVVTFKGNGGTPSTQKTTNTIYAKYGAFPSVSWANHVFLGWYTAASEGDGKRVYTNSTVTLAGTRTLWAQWTDKQVVTFRGNGGTPDVQRLTNTMGKAYGTLPEPKRSGQVFQGWFTAEEGGTQVKGTDKATAATARTLWAHWTDRQVTVFKGNGGTPKTQRMTNTIYAAYGELPTATLSEHVLTGWYTAADGGKRVYTNSTVTLAAERTLYAHWTDQQVVTFKGNGGTPSAQKTTNTIYAKYGAFPSVSWANHVFLGWYTAASEGDGKRVYTNSTVTLADTRTLWAQWTDKQVVTFRGNGGSPDVQRLTNTMGKAYGTLPEPKRSGQMFQGWFTAEEGGIQVKGTDKATAATTRTLYAHWSDRQVVTFKGNGGTPSTQKTTNTIYAAYGTLPSATRSGQVLEGWYTAADGGKRVYTNSTVTLAAARTLYAHWTDQQVVTFKGNGGRPGTQKTTNTIYAKYGAFPSVEWSGHVFQGWYNAAEGGKRVYTNSTVTLAATRTLYAHWTTGRGFAITAIAVGADGGEDGPAPRAVRGEEKAENVCRLRFELSAGTEYEIQCTPSMAGEWETVERLTAETDGEVEVEIEVPGGEKGFFRLVVFGDAGEAD